MVLLVLSVTEPGTIFGDEIRDGERDQGAESGDA